jgi:hypothetical protein
MTPNFKSLEEKKRQQGRIKSAAQLNSDNFNLSPKAAQPSEEIFIDCRVNSRRYLTTKIVIDCRVNSRRYLTTNLTTGGGRRGNIEKDNNSGASLPKLVNVLEWSSRPLI